MAAGLLKRLWEESGGAPSALEILSAGTMAFPGLAATPHAVTVAGAAGIDLADHRSRVVDGALLRSVDLVLAMTVRHSEHMQTLAPDVSDRIYTLGEFVGLGADVPDPFGGPVEEYRETFRTLERALRLALERIHREGISQ